ncbi:MAG: RpoL/Rpb11 RNA polymerase subunit family protein [Nitrosopumilaceae archaeon]
MNAQITKSSSKEVNLSISQSDIGTLYIVQHELLKEKDIDFAGLIIKHPLTNECWMRVNSSKTNPLKEITNATESAIKSVEELKKLFNSKIKVN